MTPPPLPALPAGPGDRPGIPLEEEPLEAFRPLTAGAGEPRPVVPTAGGPPELEEEPALWPDVGDGRPAPG